METLLLGAAVGLLLLLLAAIAFFLGYGFRGLVRGDLSLASSESVRLADRLDDAARGPAGELEDQVAKIIGELRSKL